MSLERVDLFNKKDFLSFLFLCLFILCYSLLIHFENYKNLTQFDYVIVNATVLKQYKKSTQSKNYQILKLKTANGTTFYTNAKESLPSLKGKKLTLQLYASKISFYNYLTSFYAFTKILHIDKQESFKAKVNSYIELQHQNEKISTIYKALFTASPLTKELQTIFSSLGVSHLLAISGFHLGVLSALLFFLLKTPYQFFQNRYFPYRNSKSDLFIIVIVSLLLYLLFLDSPPSLLRAFAMLLIGFLLYDRGITIISMQTLLLTVILLIVFFPKLFFALGFWLSVSGVFYIFLFLIHFKHLTKLLQFILIPFWVYILMLPFSLVIFTNFSLYHPLSIFWTTLFTLFYPLSIVLHLFGFGSAFDGILKEFLLLSEQAKSVELSYIWLALHILLSLLSIFFKRFIWLLLAMSFSLLIYAIYYIT